MNETRSQFSVTKMAAILGVSKSGFYDWLDRPTSPRAQRRLQFDVDVKATFDKNKAIFGSTRIMRELVKQGHGKNHKRVAESMVRQGLRSKTCKKFIPSTTDSRHDSPVAPNILNRNFTTEKPDQVWVTDITYLPSRVGWLYLTVFIDLFSRLVVGWAVSAKYSSIRHPIIVLPGT